MIKTAFFRNSGARRCDRALPVPFVGVAARSAPTTALTVAGMALLSPLPASADEFNSWRGSYRGVWAGSGTHCRSPDEFMWIYAPRKATFPHHGSSEPGRSCKVVEASGRRPVWKLRFSCQHPDPQYALPRPFDVRQTLRLDDRGMGLVVETEAVLGQPARKDDLFFCRAVSEPEPMLRCFNEKTGGITPCEP
jgi:hypothetical protein